MFPNLVTHLTQSDFKYFLHVGCKTFSINNYKQFEAHFCKIAYAKLNYYHNFGNQIKYKMSLNIFNTFNTFILLSMFKIYSLCKIFNAIPSYYQTFSLE